MLSNQNHNEQTDINTVVGCIVRVIVIGCLLSALVSGCYKLAVLMTSTRIEVSIIGPRITFGSFIVAILVKRSEMSTFLSN